MTRLECRAARVMWIKRGSIVWQRTTCGETVIVGASCSNSTVQIWRVGWWLLRRWSDTISWRRCSCIQILRLIFWKISYNVLIIYTRTTERNSTMKLMAMLQKPKPNIYLESVSRYWDYCHRYKNPSPFTINPTKFIRQIVKVWHGRMIREPNT